MKEGQRLWTRDELLLAINLYCKLPFGRLDRKTPEVITLANLISRTPDAVAYKLVNFASLDPSQKARGIKGASNTSKLDKAVWTEYFNNLDELAFESEKLLAKYSHMSIEEVARIEPEMDIHQEGKERDQLIKVRVNQSFFRKTILAAYNNTCCITGLNSAELLVAAHIRPWSLDTENRLNPRNGLAINALHDKAFESGLITITPDYRVKVSSKLKEQSNNPSVRDFFLDFAGKDIVLPSRFLPDKDFLTYHNKERFRD